MIEEQLTLKGEKISRFYGEGSIRTAALSDVSLDLYRGQLALLMGPSGSGKSTLLAIMSGLLQPSEGNVFALDGKGMRDVWHMTPQEREEFRLKYCGFIFQGYNLFPALSARQQLEIILRWGTNSSTRESRKRSDNMLSLLGLGNKGHLKPAQLSGGEKQRVAIGRALIKEPQFVFADEPTSALDWSSGERVIELLRSAAHESGATILIVSHDHRIKPFVDVHFHLEDGKLDEGKPPMEMEVPDTIPAAEAWRHVS
jgi:putative ABC transport system ATP-binding protein